MDVEKVIEELCSYPFEKEWFEFKENWFEARALGEYVAALSNSAAMVGRRCGYLVWGVRDGSHEVVGTSFDPDRDVRHEPLKHFLARQLSPSVDFDFEESDIGGRRVVVLSVAAAKTVPTSFAGERYVRIGSSKENLKRFPEREARLFEVLRHGLPTIESTPSENQNLTFEQLRIYYGAKGLSVNPETYERNLGLFCEDGRYNMMAQLLSDDSGLPLRVAIFTGRDKMSPMHSVREFGHQCLLYTLDDVLRYIDVIDVVRADERNRVVERKDVPLFDGAVVREAVVNAFVHNAWITGNEPMITVFSDRIEILSRGSLAPEQTIDGFFAGESIPVNRRLSEIFLQLHISEKTGRGVPRIAGRYGRSAFEFRENSIVVTIPFDSVNEGGASLIEGNGEASAKLKARDKVLLALRDNPNASKDVIAAAAGVSRSSVTRALAQLKNEGAIERVGSNKTGFWRVL